MESVSNFRELSNLPVSGGTIAPGVLFRSGHLADLSDEDSQQITEAGIRTFVDLRTANDIKSEGADRVPNGVTHHHVPIFDDGGSGERLRDMIMRGDLNELREQFGDGKSHQLALDGAAGFAENPDRMASFATAMAIVTNPDNWPLLWHCSAGKDRAGWVGTSVLLAAGATPDVIVDHYLESNKARGTISLSWEGELKDLIHPFLAVQEDYVRAQLDVVENTWGGVEGLYRDGFGLSEEALDQFRNALIAGS